MKNLLRVSTLSIFTRVLLTFLLVIFPLFFLGAALYTRATSIVMGEISSSMSSKVHFYLLSLEKEIERNIDTKREFVNDSDVLKLSIAGAEMSDYDRSQAVKRIAERLELLQNSSIYIKNVHLYIPSLEKSISVEDWFAPISEEDFQGLRRLAEQEGESPFIWWKNKLYLVEIYPNAAPAPAQQPVFLLSIELDQSELQNFLKQLNTYSSGGAAVWNKEGAISSQIDDSCLKEVERQLPDVLSESKRRTRIMPVTIGKQRFYAVYEYSSLLDSALLTYTPEEQVLGPLMKLRFLLGIIAAVSILVVTVFSYRVFRMIHQPLRKLVKAFGSMKRGDLQPVLLPHKRQDEFYYLYQSFNDMVDRLRTLIQEVYEQKIRVQRSELKQLQTQINPHFLYNSFYIVRRMATLADLEGIERFTKHLGDYFQFITRSDSDEVTLEAEWQHALAYVEIQNFRFYNRISSEFVPLAEELQQLRVPRLILQPIIENAYKYALEGKTANGLLRVRAEWNEITVYLIVEDNGTGMSSAELSAWNAMLTDNRGDLEEITAILNIHRRMQIKYGPRAGVTLAPSEWGGMKVTLAIPKEWKEGA